MHNIGNGWCQDEYNIEDCDWDGGDCCPNTCPPGVKLRPNTVWTYECAWKAPYNCKDPYNHECTGSNNQIGDGVCRRDLNVPECHYDGGDCW